MEGDGGALGFCVPTLDGVCCEKPGLFSSNPGCGGPGGLPTAVAHANPTIIMRHARAPCARHRHYPSGCNNGVQAALNTPASDW